MKPEAGLEVVDDHECDELLVVDLPVLVRVDLGQDLEATSGFNLSRLSLFKLQLLNSAVNLFSPVNSFNCWLG